MTGACHFMFRDVERLFVSEGIAHDVHGAFGLLVLASANQLHLPSQGEFLSKKWNKVVAWRRANARNSTTKVESGT